jgi:hypothetical protein
MTSTIMAVLDRSDANDADKDDNDAVNCDHSITTSADNDDNNDFILFELRLAPTTTTTI